MELIKLNHQHEEILNVIAKQKLHQQSILVEMGKKSYVQINELKTELIVAFEKQQSDRVENAAMKIELTNMKEQKQKHDSEIDKITKELADVYCKIIFFIE